MSYKFTRRVGQYIISHWRGEHTLARAFWINSCLMTTVIISVHITIKNYVGSLDDIIFESRVILPLIVLIATVFFPWQMVGLFRTTRINANAIKNKTKLLHQLIMLLLAVELFILISTLIYGKDMLYDRFEYSLSQYRQGGYSISVSKDFNNMAMLNGEFNKGISKKLESVLADNPQVNILVLNSGGGLSYEAIKVFDIVKKNNLHTYVIKKCSSACIKAFIAGEKRIIADKGALGFHQPHPRFLSKKYSKEALKIFLDEYVELLTSQGVSKDFANKVFQAGPEDMWIPSNQELLEAGVVFKIIK